MPVGTDSSNESFEALSPWSPVRWRQYTCSTAVRHAIRSPRVKIDEDCADETSLRSRIKSAIAREMFSRQIMDSPETPSWSVKDEADSKSHPPSSSTPHSPKQD